MNEEWKDIEGYKGLYQISNLGKVKRFYKNGKIKILKPRLNHKGYERVSLCKNSNDHKEFCVHRLVGKTFIENPLGKPQINHINGNKLDNTIYNLEWVTPKENCIHRNKLNSMI